MNFRILGSLEVRHNERELSLGAGRQRALLAILLLHANELVSIDRLIEDLWGEQPPATAPKIVQNLVSQLRRVLGDARLVTRGHGYVLEVEPGALDLERFESLAREGSRALAGGDPETASVKLREAISLWRGAPLADFAYEPFAQPAIARLEELRLAAIEERIDAELQMGLHAELVGELEALVKSHPLREQLCAQLMTALYRSGRQAEALQVYRDARGVLVGELGLEPSEELQSLERAILGHEPKLAAPPRPGPAAPPPAEPARAAPASPHRGLRRPLALATVGALLVAGSAVAAALTLTGGSKRRPVVVAPNSVAVVDPGTGRLLRQIRVGSRPIAIAVDENGVWVANADDGTVSRIDPKTMSVVDTIGTGTPASDIADGGGSIWVANGSEGTVTEIDPRTNAKVDTIDLSGPDGIAPEGAYSVVTGDGAVWVGSGSGNVVEIDPATGEVVADIPVGATPADIAFGEGDLWVARIGGRVLRIDPGTRTVTGVVAAAPGARAMAVGEGAVWVTDVALADTGVLWRIDPASVTISGGTTKLAGAPMGVATGGGAVWVAGGSSGALVKIDPRSGNAVGSIPLGNPPLDVAYGRGVLWVTVGAREAATT